MTASVAAAPVEPLRVPRYDTEIPLLLVVALLSFSLWVLLIVSIVGIVYAVFLGLFFFFAHLGFIAYLRGSAIRLGPDQLPELHARVVAISQRLGMKEPPEAYLMQAEGSLNALATKFFSANFIVLFSDLLEACGDDSEAADFIIAHEIGHLKAGHLRFRTFLILGRLVPFIGSAWSRACEYTADRYGFTAVTDRSAAVRGLTVLAAGGKYAGRVNLDAFVAQRGAMDTVMMTLGHWMASHPALAFRVAEIDQERFPRKSPAAAPIVGAIGLILGVMMLPAAGMGLFFLFKFVDLSDLLGVPSIAEGADAAHEDAADEESSSEVDAELQAKVMADFESLALTAEEYRKRTGEYPRSADALYAAHQLVNGAAAPHDPFDGEPYGYFNYGDSFYLYSSGSDDLTWDSAVQTKPETIPEAEGR
jgi:Zn-dependent protease with chaperone function